MPACLLQCGAIQNRMHAAASFYKLESETWNVCFLKKYIFSLILLHGIIVTDTYN